MSDPKKMWCLANFNLFSCMTTDDINMLEPKVTHHEMQKGQEIYLPGDTANTVYLLKGGKVKISRLNEDGKEVLLHVLSTGDVFGELAILEEAAAREEIARAMDDCTVCAVPRDDFEKFLMMKPELNLKITKLIGMRLKKIENRVQNLIYKDTVERLRYLLQQLAEDHGRKHPQGILIHLKLNHQEIASLINASRQTVSESIAQLKEEGFLITEGHKIILTPSTATTEKPIVAPQVSNPS